MRFKFSSIFTVFCFTFKTISFSHWQPLSLDIRATCIAPTFYYSFSFVPPFLRRRGLQTSFFSRAVTYIGITTVVVTFFVRKLSTMAHRYALRPTSYCRL